MTQCFVRVLGAVDVGDDAALGPRDDDRLTLGVSPRTHDVLLVLGDDRVGFGGRKRRLRHCGSFMANLPRRARCGCGLRGAKRYRRRGIDVKLRIYGDVTGR